MAAQEREEGLGGLGLRRLQMHVGNKKRNRFRLRCADDRPHHHVRNPLGVAVGAATP